MRFVTKEEINKQTTRWNQNTQLVLFETQYSQSLTQSLTLSLYV